MPGATRDRISYSVGNEHNPGNPFGRQHLVIDVDGRARLDHYTVGPHFAWTGTARSDVIDRIFRALAESDFPALPTMNMVAGATTRSLSIGNGLAARSTFLDYHKALSLPGYAVVFPLLDSLVRQLSEDEVKVVPPRDEVLVDDVHATDTEEPRDITPGIAYLFAYLPAHAIAIEARKDLVERFAEAADEKLAHAIELSRRALKLETTRMEAAERRISAMARRDRLEIARGGPAWRAIADAVRPHLGTELSRAAWSAGEAARLVLVSVALLAHTAYLRCAAPDHPGLRELAEDRARALVENADLLTERLGATGLRLVMSHADSVAKMVELSRSFLLATTSGGHTQLVELDKDLDSFVDGHARRLDETPPRLRQHQ